MKKLLIIITILSGFSSCKDEPSTPTRAADPEFTMEIAEANNWTITKITQNSIGYESGVLKIETVSDFDLSAGSMNFNDSAYVMTYQGTENKTTKYYDPDDTKTTSEATGLKIEVGFYSISNDGKTINLTETDRITERYPLKIKSFTGNELVLEENIVGSNALFDVEINTVYELTKR